MGAMMQIYAANCCAVDEAPAGTRRAGQLRSLAAAAAACCGLCAGLGRRQAARLRSLTFMDSAPVMVSGTGRYTARCHSAVFVSTLAFSCETALHKPSSTSSKGSAALTGDGDEGHVEDLQVGKQEAVQGPIS